MHLVFLNQYYPPDAAPTGVMLASVAEELVAQGHRVTVICAEGGYAEGKARGQRAESRDRTARASFASSNENLEVLRIRATRFGRGTFLGKVIDYLSYYLGVAGRLAVMQPRPDRIVALTTPP